MYDELVKRLREHNGWALNETLDKAADAIEELVGFVQEAERDRDEYRERLDKATDAIEDLENKLNLWRHDKISRWIPVAERLPNEDGWYQVYAPWYSGGSSSGLKNINGNMYSAFKHGKWSIEVGYHKRPGCVKAWMPLPQPPKEEE